MTKDLKEIEVTEEKLVIKVIRVSKVTQEEMGVKALQETREKKEMIKRITI